MKTIFSRFMCLSAVISPQILLILNIFLAKNRLDMEIWTINFGKSPGDQVQSGQNVRIRPWVESDHESENMDDELNIDENAQRR